MPDGLSNYPDSFWVWLRDSKQWGGRISGKGASFGTANIPLLYKAFLKQQWTNQGLSLFYVHDLLSIQSFPAGFTRDMSSSISSRLNELGQKVVDRASELTPKRTGRLSSSYRYSVTGTELSVWNDLDYFIFVENELHMLRDAYNEFAPQITTLIQQDAQNLVRTR